MELMPLQAARVAFHMDRLAQHPASFDWSEMGTGKSVSALAVANQLAARRVLYVGPGIMGGPFAREVEAWSGLTPVRVTGGKPDLPEGDQLCVIMSYDTMRLQAKRLADERWDLVIFDEHQLIKERGAKRTRIAVNVVAPTAAKILLMSGTPAPNHYGELWVALRAFAPERVEIFTHEGYMNKFTNRVPTPFGDGLRVTGSKGGAELAAIMDGAYTRDKLADVWADDPGMSLQNMWIDAADCPHDAWRMAEDEAALVREMGDDADDIHLATYRRLIGEAKAPQVARTIVSELLDGMYSQVVVFYHHRSVGDILAAALDGAGRIDGNTPSLKRAAIIDGFQAGGRPILLAQLQVMNAGVTLTAANHVVIVEPDWTPGVNAQAIARCHRIGQRHQVHARLVGALNTLDESIVETITRKARELREVLE